MNISVFTTQSPEEALKSFGVSLDHGLSPEQVEQSRATHGGNALTEHRVTGWSIMLRQFQSSFVYLLIGAAVLAFVLGEVIDGTMIVIFVLVNALLGFIQEYRSEKTSQLLKTYTVQHTQVKRSGEVKRIPSSEVVPGDIVIYEAGDIISADARVITESHALVNESVLTGESVQVKKTSTALKTATDQIYEASNIVFSGTSLVSGEVQAVALATGKNTAMGEVTTLTTDTHRISSFEKEINGFSRFILRLVVVTLVIVFIANLILKGPTDWVDLVIFAIALAVGVIPEGLPVVTTFSLSRGALRLSKQHVVVKRLTAIEDLGGIEVLCTDKTGTLTENVLTVADVRSTDRAATLWAAALAGSEVVYDQSQQPNNSFDLAIWKELSPALRERLAQSERLSEVPFDPERRRNSVLTVSEGKRMLLVRGAAEVIAEYCSGLGVHDRAEIASWVASQGVQGRRVIMLAHKEFSKSEYVVEDEIQGLQYIGCISFVDPIKASTPQALADAKELGIQVKVLTGDSREVAGAVGFDVGLVKTQNEVMLASELEALPHADQLRKVMEFNVFARVSPQQKYRIIQLLQENGTQVGFLGEGINDAPALKIANISLVVQGASDIAREAADVILLQQSLEVIVDGIREGRSVFANTMKYIQATLSSNFGNFYAVAIVSLFIDFLPMLPLQILLLNVVSDFPMISIAADRVDPNELVKPKTYHIKDILRLATILGLVSTVFDFLYFFVFRGGSPEHLQTNWFMGSVLTELLFLFSIRTRGFFLKGTRPAPIILFFTGVAACITLVIPFTSIGQNVFSLVPPTGMQLLLILAIAVCYMLTTECAKLLYFRKTARSA